MLYWYARSTGELAMGVRRFEFWKDGAHYVPFGSSKKPDPLDAVHVWEKGKG